MKELHRKAIVSSLLCLLLCGNAISTSVDDENHDNKSDLLNRLKQMEQNSNPDLVPNSLNSENNPTLDPSSPSKQTKSEHIFIRTSTLSVHSLTPSVVRKEYEDGNNTSLTLMLAMIGVAVGTALALGTIAIIFIIRRRAATNKEVSRKIAQRTNMYVIRNDNYDLNKTLSGIPSATDIWREIKIDS